MPGDDDPNEATTVGTASAAAAAPTASAPPPNMVTVTDAGIAIDSYPYTFSPLLLFAQESYFDKGYSNYNSVAKFFEAQGMEARDLTRAAWSKSGKSLRRKCTTNLISRFSQNVVNISHHFNDS